MRSHRRLSHSGRLIALLALVAVVLLSPDLSQAARQLGGDQLPDVLLATAHLTCWAVSSWVLLIAVASVARIRVPGVPHAVQTLLFATAVVAVAAAPAHAEDQHELTGLALPDRPMVRTVSPIDEADVVVIRPGESLWTLALDHLSPSATDAEIAAAVAAWHHANHAEIGADPDLIHPGQRLTPPTQETS